MAALYRNVGLLTLWLVPCPSASLYTMLREREAKSGMTKNCGRYRVSCTGVRVWECGFALNPAGVRVCQKYSVVSSLFGNETSRFGCTLKQKIHRITDDNSSTFGHCPRISHRWATDKDISLWGYRRRRESLHRLISLFLSIVARELTWGRSRESLDSEMLACEFSGRPNLIGTKGDILIYHGLGKRIKQRENWRASGKRKAMKLSAKCPAKNIIYRLRF